MNFAKRLKADPVVRQANRIYPINSIGNDGVCQKRADKWLDLVVKFLNGELLKQFEILRLSSLDSQEEFLRAMQGAVAQRYKIATDSKVALVTHDRVMDCRVNNHL